LPGTLTASVIAFTGDCDCYNAATTTLTFDPVAGWWHGIVSSCGPDWDIILRCLGGVYNLSLGDGSDSNLTVNSCSPLSLSGNLTPSSIICSGTVTWEITS
jgi:hypothetical protein